jgi:hypothetical protein
LYIPNRRRVFARCKHCAQDAKLSVKVVQGLLIHPQQSFLVGCLGNARNDQCSGLLKMELKQDSQIALTKKNRTF